MRNVRKRRTRKPISARTHGVIDYTTSAAVAAAPFVFDMPRRARVLFEGLAAGYTGLSAMTDYPLAARRAIPFKAHGVAELAVAAALPALPWILGFQKNRAARNICFGLAAMSLAVAALTDWDDDSD
jgi:hypothetical protein